MRVVWAAATSEMHVSSDAYYQTTMGESTGLLGGASRTVTGVLSKRWQGHDSHTNIKRRHPRSYLIHQLMREPGGCYNLFEELIKEPHM